MQLQCRFFGPFREAVGEKAISYEKDVETVGELVAELEDTYPDLEGKLVDEATTEPAKNTVITVDNRNITQIDGLETVLEEGATVRFAQAVHGG